MASHERPEPLRDITIPFLHCRHQRCARWDDEKQQTQLQITLSQNTRYGVETHLLDNCLDESPLSTAHT